jgi:predicted DNA-binding transcriptional regulator YafY
VRATRLLRTLHLLSARGRLSASQLAAELDVSVRTVYRDIETLSSAGFPVFAEQGPSGGSELLTDFRSPFVVLTPAEIALLVRLGPPPVAGELGVGGDVDHAFDKLAVALARASASQHRQLVFVDAPRWFNQAGTPLVLEPLGRAVAESQRVVIHRSGREQIVDPLGVVNKAGRWYVVGNHAGTTSVMRLDRIDRVELLPDRFDAPAGFDLETFWSGWVADFEASRATVEVAVEVGRDAVDDLPKALGDHVAEALAGAEPDEQGNRVVQLRFFSVEAAVHHLTGAGHLATVVSPAGIRAAVLERAATVLGRAP